jgi:hypothetical protein
MSRFPVIDFSHAALRGGCHPPSHGEGKETRGLESALNCCTALSFNTRAQRPQKRLASAVQPVEGGAGHVAQQAVSESPPSTSYRCDADELRMFQFQSTPLGACYDTIACCVHCRYNHCAAQQRQPRTKQQVLGGQESNQWFVQVVSLH